MRAGRHRSGVREDRDNEAVKSSSPADAAGVRPSEACIRKRRPESRPFECVDSDLALLPAKKLLGDYRANDARGKKPQYPGFRHGQRKKRSIWGARPQRLRLAHRDTDAGRDTPHRASRQSSLKSLYVESFPYFRPNHLLATKAPPTPRPKRVMGVGSGTWIGDTPAKTGATAIVKKKQATVSGAIRLGTSSSQRQAGVEF